MAGGRGRKKAVPLLTWPGAKAANRAAFACPDGGGENDQQVYFRRGSRAAMDGKLAT
jgi:hypothetical protein